MEVLDQLAPQGEDVVDSTGEQVQQTDYNFDILRQHYAGTDFESEANSLCDLISSIHSRTGDAGKAVPVFLKLRMALKGDDGQIHPGFEPFDDFAGMVEQMFQTINKAGYGQETTQPPQIGEQQDGPPDVKDAQAKLLELENYLQTSGLIKRQKWVDYLESARKQAAVGDDSFEVTPKAGMDDEQYLQESERQKMLREGQKQAILQGLVGANIGQ
jgi:hypothetical protein